MLSRANSYHFPLLLHILHFINITSDSAEGDLSVTYKSFRPGTRSYMLRRYSFKKTKLNLTYGSFWCDPALTQL